MKIISLLLLIIFLAAACKKETLAPVEVLMETATDTMAMQTGTGQFMNGPYGSVTGKAILFKNTNGSYEIKLENFNTSNGPDLYVYLSKEIMPVNFIQFEKLRSTNGNQVYPVPGSPDFTQYKYVSIHCKQYNHLFGYALLQ